MFILPVNRDNIYSNTPWVLVALTVVNTLLLAGTYFFGPAEAIFKQYGFTPADPHFHTMFTSMFLHAGVGHLFGNMWFLWMFGARVEQTIGRLGFVLSYLAAGVGGAGLHYAFNPSSTIPCIGASGAISGIVGVYFVLFPRSLFNLEVYFGRFHVKTIPARTHAAIGAWVAEQTLLGLLSGLTRFLSVAFWAHVGGFAAGVVCALVFTRLRPRRTGLEPMVLSVPVEIFIPAHSLPAVANWYKTKLGFVKAESSSDEDQWGSGVAMKPGGDGPPIVFEQAGTTDRPTTIWINAKKLEHTRTVLGSRGVRVSHITKDQQGTPYFSFPDIEGNHVRVTEEPRSWYSGWLPEWS